MVQWTSYKEAFVHGCRDADKVFFGGHDHFFDCGFGKNIQVRQYIHSLNI